MDSRRRDLDLPLEGEEDDDVTMGVGFGNSKRAEFGNATNVMARVFLPPGFRRHSRSDVPDASPVGAPPPGSPLLVTTAQPPAENNAKAENILPQPTTAEPGIEAEDDESEKYNMQHRRRGVALIFNHEKFDESGMRRREGADKDGDALRRVLEMLSFDVRYHVDLTVAELRKVLRDVSLEDHKDADCLFVAVMTHGEKGDLLHAKDNPLKVDDIWRPFTADKVPSLAGKPKVFLIQACRGTMVDQPVWLADETDSSPSEMAISIPTRADFLFAHSTLEGFYSWRNPDDGSWFVQDFCKVLTEHGRRKDLLTLMTLTLKRVAFNRQSNALMRRDLHRKKQMPVFSSTLTKLVYFDSTSV